MSIIISFLYPITVFLALQYFDIKLNDMFFLKLLPLLISSYILFLITLSYFKDSSFILRFAKKFSKNELSEIEINYIKKSTLFWAVVSLINVVLHVVVLLHVNEYYWVFYSSFGWYFVFGFGGVLQYLHRKFVFLKRVENV